MGKELIHHWEYEIAEAPCAPGSGRFSVKITLAEDISAVFPYLNAVLEDTVYDHTNKILIGCEKGRTYAFREKQVMVSGVDEVTQAPGTVKGAIELINRIWNFRNEITPILTERKQPVVMDIYRHLPKTNCRQCGYASCLVFSAELRNGACRLEQCLPLAEPAQHVRYEAIRKLFGTT